MAVCEEASQLTNAQECTPKVHQETLLSKYRIPVQHLDFGYIEKCKDGRELEKIVQILRSGEEGYYPQLTQAAEERLGVIKPKSKLLRKVCPVLTVDSLDKKERNELHNDLKEWVNNVSKNDNKLDLFRVRKIDKTTLPDVRETKINNNTVDMKTNNNTKRISSTDYQSWDKYDPDTEILKMEIEEEKLKQTFIKNEKKKKSNKKSVQFKEFHTDVEAGHEANYEKDKGNEFFKAGDYKEALQHYTNSINCKPIAASYTNRAFTHIKLKKFKNAVDDCNSALTLEPSNFKAFLRKAQALDMLGKHQSALEAIESAIEIDPNNTVAQELAGDLRKKCRVVLKNTRFAIEEVKSNEKKQKQTSKIRKKLIIPIPGTSKMSPPHYIECSENNPRKIKEELVKANMQSVQVLHLVSIENNSVEDEDSCTVNHLKRVCSKTRLEKNERNDKLIPILEINEEVIKKGEEPPKIIIQDKKNARKIREKNSMRDQEDKKASGEPFVKEGEIEFPNDLHSPYSFLKTWNSANSDATLEQHAAILRRIDMNRITEVIGCKLDNAMFSTMIKCLSIHFAVPGEIDRLHFILENLVNLARFDIISLLMSPEDRNYINILINFLNQHGKPLLENTVNKLLN